jgi:hypothetical protein
MSEFRPLQEQEAEPLPERPLLNLQLGDSFNTARIPEVRNAVIDFLRENPDLLLRVGCPIPDSLIGDIKLVLAELLSNAERPDIEHPEASRHATAVYVWADTLKVGIGVGDDSDTIAGKDGRPQTALLPPDLGAVALNAYDESFALDGLQSSGLGGNLLSMLATHVSYSKVSESEAARTVEPRTHKIVRADFSVPWNSAQNQAA